MDGFRPPPYPYERLAPLREKADAHPGGVVDLSVGTPNDAPPRFVVDALAASDAERGYPASVGTPTYREAASGWMKRRLGVDVPAQQVAACVGTKEFVASLPQYLRLRHPGRDTVLFPELAYPTYEMGAILAGCRPVPVPVDDRGALDLSAVADDEAERALLLWVNAPGNPAGQIDDLAAAAAWGRARGVPVFSDECYVEFTWTGEPRTILSNGTDGVVALHSASKRSNAAGLRAGFYAGDGDLVAYLSEVRKHAGLLVPGPVQAAAAAAWGDDGHVEEQRERYRTRLERFRETLAGIGVFPALPAGGFYLWAEAPGGNGWELTERLAVDGGALVAPGEIFGSAGRRHIRVAVVQNTERLDLVRQRLEATGRGSS